jgi:hypothetical protein
VARDQETRDDIKDVDPDIPAVDGKARMVEDDGKNGDGPQAFDVRAKSPKPDRSVAPCRSGPGLTGRRACEYHRWCRELSTELVIVG